MFPEKKKLEVWLSLSKVNVCNRGIGVQCNTHLHSHGQGIIILSSPFLDAMGSFHELTAWHFQDFRKQENSRFYLLVIASKIVSKRETRLEESMFLNQFIMCPKIPLWGSGKSCFLCRQNMPQDRKLQQWETKRKLLLLAFSTCGLCEQIEKREVILSDSPSLLQCPPHPILWPSLLVRLSCSIAKSA